MIGRPNIRTFALVASLLLFVMVALAACGGGSSTTTSPTNTSVASTNRPKAPRPVTGTITDYNTGTDALTVKDANGTTHTFTLASTTRIVKSQKITEQQLGPLVATNGMSVIVMGSSTGTDTYTAQELIVSDIVGATPNRNGASARPAGTPGARPAQGNGGNRGVFVQKGKVQNNQLIGQNIAGQTVTVNLSGTTTMFQELTGTASDLKSGLNVTVNAGPMQAGGTSTVRQIIVGDLPRRGPATN
jgi:hypothetical protein